MPLDVFREITSLETFPNSNTEGFDVSEFAGAMLTISELENVTSYTLAQYVQIDDQNPVLDANGNPVTPRQTTSTYPNGVDWPELDQYRIQRFKQASIFIPLNGVNRWQPALLAWNNPSGSPSVTLRAKFLHTGAVASLASLGALAALSNLSDTEIQRIATLGTDANTPVTWASLTTIDPESADVIRINLTAADINNTALTEAVRFRIVLKDLTNVKHDTADFQVRVVGPGDAGELSFTPTTELYAITDSATGVAYVEITDVVGGSGAIVLWDVDQRVRVGEGISSFVAFD